MCNAPLPDHVPVLVIGGGLAGLSCARLLAAEGKDVHLVEASDRVGGRVRTDEVDGFLLDRGFQIMLTAYPELQAQVDLDRLDLQKFRAGSLIRTKGSFHMLADPWKNPSGAFASLFSSVGSIGDKVRTANLRRELRSQDLNSLLASDDRSTLEELRAHGFSEEFIDLFFRPFLGGVFLERELVTSARLFRYLFRLFADGDAAVPAAGMEALPRQLAEPLEGRITTGTPATGVESDRVFFKSEKQVRADRIVIAADGPALSSLLGRAAPAYKTTVTTYFDAPEAPVQEAMLLLDGESRGPVNHLCVMSNVAASYAPAGRHLIAASGVGAAARRPELFEEGAREQLESWFGTSVRDWRTIRSYTITNALPHQPAGSLNVDDGPDVSSDGLIVCGDHRLHGSLQGAMESGRRAAEIVLG